MERARERRTRKKRGKGNGGRSKRNKGECTLEHVVGVTALHNAALASNPVTGELACPAGCVVVVYDGGSGRQTQYFRCRKTVSALAYSPDGRFLAVGERGREPSVTVWDVQTGKVMASVPGHKFGVACLTFTHDGRYVVTVGFKHDHQLVAWDWEQSTVAAMATFKGKIYSISCHEDGAFLMTAGEDGLVLWDLVPDLRDRGGHADGTASAVTEIGKL